MSKCVYGIWRVIDRVVTDDPELADEHLYKTDDDSTLLSADEVVALAIPSEPDEVLEAAYDVLSQHFSKGALERGMHCRRPEHVFDFLSDERQPYCRESPRETAMRLLADRVCASILYEPVEAYDVWGLDKECVYADRASAERAIKKYDIDGTVREVPVA